MRFRLGDEKKQADEAFNGIGRQRIMIDHCSMSWAVDECASFYDNKDFTLQWSIISESLRNSVHPKGEHGYGGIWGGQGASFHHNILASNTSRNPRFCGSRYTQEPAKEIVDFTNNVIFNWVHNSAYGGEGGNHNIVNNYYKAGPATKKNVRSRIVNPWDTAAFTKFYVAGNYVDGFEKVTADNWAGGVQCEHPEMVRLQTPVKVVAIPPQTALAAYKVVLQQAGASLHRDVIDARIVQEISSGKTTFADGIIDAPANAGGWPLLKSLAAPKDTDEDGMPDEWERKHGLDPQEAKDASTFTLDKQYTNIEMYLNSLL
jgi:hypothetical protein